MACNFLYLKIRPRIILTIPSRRARFSFVPLTAVLRLQWNRSSPVVRTSSMRVYVDDTIFRFVFLLKSPIWMYTSNGRFFVRKTTRRCFRRGVRRKSNRTSLKRDTGYRLDTHWSTNVWKNREHKSTVRRVLQESDDQPLRALSPGVNAVSLTPSGISERCVRSRRTCGKFPHYVSILVLNSLFLYIIARSRRSKSYDSRFRTLSSSLESFLFFFFCDPGRFRRFVIYASHKTPRVIDYGGRRRDKGHVSNAVRRWARGNASVTGKKWPNTKYDFPSNGVCGDCSAVFKRTYKSVLVLRRNLDEYV